MPLPPDGLWSDLDPGLPLALVPLRLETRFGSREAVLDDGSTVPVPVLRVRIYPDDISVPGTPPGLTAVEQEAGADFWAARDAPETPEESAVPGTLEHRRRAAWEVLARRVGSTRTAYVAGATRPGAPPPPERTDQAATARLLPDAWVLTGYLDGQQVLTEHVVRADADLQVGPSRDRGRDAFDPDDPHLLRPEDGLRWTTDFDAAVAVGMATVIDLQTPQDVQGGQVLSLVALRGLDTLVVVGARSPRAGRTAETEAAALADLLAAHAVSERVGFVAQGTPTNNLTDQPSGWSSASDVYAGYDRVVDPAAAPPPFSPVATLRGGASDGAAFEAALGLPAGVTAGWEGAAGREQWHARCAALALFPTTIGEVVGTLGRPGSLNGIVTQTAVDRYLDQLDTVMPFVREHVAAFVRGRGPLPALRVGRQPYGVLPVVAPGPWTRTADEPEQLTRLHDVLGVVRSFFEPAAGRVPTLHGAADTATELVRVLGLSPVPHPGAYAVREVTGRASTIMVMMSESPPVPAGPAGPGGAGPADAQLFRRIAASGALDAGITTEAYRRLLALTLDDLVHGTQLEWLALGGAKQVRVPVARTDPDRHGWESPSTYLSRLCRDVIDLFVVPGARPTADQPRDLLFLLAQHSLALAGELDQLRLLHALDADLFTRVVAVPTEVTATALPVAQAWATAMTSPVSRLASGPVAQQLSQDTIASQVFDDGRRLALLDALQLPHEHVNGFAGTRDAVRALADAGLGDAELTRLTSETLACASTRLDAWYSSLAAQRLERQRTARPDGLQLGAWGLLTDVRPRPGTPVPEDQRPAGWAGSPGHGATTSDLVRPHEQVGFVHAPSLAQARTAGVLRAGERAHAGDGSTLASLDLTSRRVRLAHEVLDALGQGQPLGAVLGYRVERLLSDRGMHAEVAALRAAFPQRRVQGAPGEPASGSDAVVPAQVLDGYEVWQHRDQAVAACRGDGAALREVLAELDLVVEGVADLVVASGVHQITTGRTEAAGATFTAVAEGTAPPDPDVVREPRSGVTITHRTVVVLDPGAGRAGWRRTASRAVLAPQAERWAEEVLGAAGGWRFRVGARDVGLDDLDLCALDVVVEARAGAAEPPLLTRVLAAQDDPGAALDDPELVRLLALAQAAGDVLAHARPASTADLVAPPAGDSVEAGTVLSSPPPGPDVLQPVADRVAGVVTTLLDGIAAATAAVQGLDAGSPVDATLLAPFRDLGLPGSVHRGAQVPASDLLGAASAALTVLRDVDQLLVRAAPAPSAPPDAAPTRTALLAAVCADPHGLDALVEVTRRLGGQAVVPVVEVPSDLAGSRVDGVDADAVEGWLSRMGRVRAGLAAYDDLRLFLEAAGADLPPLGSFQLPLVGEEGWLADALPTAPGGNELRAWRRPDGPRTHVVATGPPDLVGAATVRALVVDEVGEVLPAPTVSTGIAAHVDAPGARPPQTVLLAVHPDPARPWGWQLLTDTAREALALTRIRGVELDDLAGSGIDEFLPLTYVRDGLDHTTPLTELTRGLTFLLEAVAANRFVEVGP